MVWVWGDDFWDLWKVLEETPQVQPLPRPTVVPPRPVFPAQLPPRPVLPAQMVAPELHDDPADDSRLHTDGMS